MFGIQFLRDGPIPQFNAVPEGRLTPYQMTANAVMTFVNSP